MSHSRRLSFFVLIAGAAALVVGLSWAEDKKNTKEDHSAHAAAFNQCAKACGECAGACESCATHCAHLLADGHKEHMHTLQTCRDCAEFCVAAARVVSRHGPMAKLICESCAKACDSCGAACQKHSEDQHMKQCADACQQCAKACRDMLGHTGRTEGQ